MLSFFVFFIGGIMGYISSKLKYGVVFLFTLISVSVFEVVAIPPPDVVYRADFRSPADIFDNGFSSWGGDLELMRHVSGDSSRDRTSGFIATTSNFDAIRRLAVELLIPTDRDDTLWIYRITPNRAFYDVNGSLLHANMMNAGTVLSGQALHLYSTFSWQEEFAASGNIISSSIINAISARRVVDDDGIAQVVIDFDNQIENPGYNYSEPAINPSYINATAILDNFPVYYVGDLRRNPIEAAFDVEGCADMRYKSTKQNTECKEGTFYNLKEVNFGKFLSVLN